MIKNVKEKSFNKVYLRILDDLLHNYDNVVEVRGHKCQELVPYVFTITDPTDRVLYYPGIRNIRTYTAAELLWYLSGERSKNMIEHYATMWTKLSDNGATVNSAYGWYLFNEEFIDKYDAISPYKNQWEWAKAKLKEDPHTRECVLHIKPPQCKPTKDYVCTLTLSFMIRKGKLDMIVNMRSSDVYYGLTYDVFMFTFLQELMAAELSDELGYTIKVGKYIHFTNNLHFYEKDREKIEKMYKELKEYCDSEDYAPAKIHKVPPRFRKYDLPYLLEAEHYLRDGFMTEKFLDWMSSILSPCGQDLLQWLLVKYNNERD